MEITKVVIIQAKWGRITRNSSYIFFIFINPLKIKIFYAFILYSFSEKTKFFIKNKIKTPSLKVGEGEKE
jgi:hypothetical protein